MLLPAGPGNQAASTPESLMGLPDDSIRSHDTRHFLRGICDECKVSQIYLVKKEGIHLLKSYLYRLV
jgi:hypothetical protein